MANAAVNMLSTGFPFSHRSCEIDSKSNLASLSFVRSVRPVDVRGRKRSSKLDLSHYWRDRPVKARRGVRVFT